MNQALKKNKVRKHTLPRGVKVVPAPKNKKLAQWLDGRDITTTGGCHTTHGHPVG